MFKLVVLSALLAVAAARPSHFESPVVYSAPAVTVQEHGYAKVGAVVKSIPTAYSHQSQSIVHSSAQVVEPIVAPVVKTTYAAAAPVVHTYAAAPVVKTYAAAPVVRSYAATPLSYATYAAAPYTTYAHAAPVSYGTYAASAPLTYTATGAAW